MEEGSERSGPTARRADPADHPRGRTATGTDRHNHDRVLDVMKAWGHDIGGLENADDVTARECYA
ncbi:hypothetical protein [Streptomyces sp. NPDC092952]|uniref:hypothetical protein n=1 Tax=Streptomyces sp. NPDC092952 TaxID=3366018 RepID=UPI0038125D94